jgi:cytochrome P450
MRLFPPAWVVPRLARKTDEVGGFVVPKGTVVSIVPYLIHRHPSFWPEPERFDPDRFLPERSADRPRHAYLPFGLGQRMCIGAALAQLEMKLILRAVLQRGRLQLQPTPEVVPEPLMTLAPKAGVWMTWSRT